MTITPLKPWAYGPFEVLMHAEMHYRKFEDLDRRVAMIGFDNAIEVAITTYVALHPIQRGNREYAKSSVEACLKNFHTKVDFFLEECQRRSINPGSKKDEIVWFHDVRNGQYHKGGAAIPQRRELDGVRSAAIEVFGVLFEQMNVPATLEDHIAAMAPLPPPPRKDEHDRVIDNAFPMIDVCGQAEYASDVLYALDPSRYREIALELSESAESQSDPDDSNGGGA